MKKRKSFPLRINAVLYKEIEAWAEQEFRSVNGQIEYILQRAVAKRKKTFPKEHSESKPDADDEP